MGKNNAKLPDIATIIQAGIDPKSGLPIRLIQEGEGDKNDVRRLMRIIDEQDAINRYKWYNLPLDISSQQLERMLYFKGQLCFFYFEELDRFYILPFALEGSIDFYGRFNTVHPIPFAAGNAGLTDGEKRDISRQESLLSTKKLKVIKEPKDLEDLTIDDFKNSCVILYDYTPQLNVNNIIPRQQINDVLVDTESEIIPYMQTALLAGTGIKGLRVNSAEAREEAERASKQIRYSALSRKLYVSMTDTVEMQEIADGSPLKSEEYLLALQSLDNLRKAALGIENGGLFQKKAHKLEEEQESNQSSAHSSKMDGIELRQAFCNICNSIWGTSMWCVLPEDDILMQNALMEEDQEDNSQPSSESEQPQEQEGGEKND